MMRNVVLVVSSLAVLVVLFVGYRLLFRTPAEPMSRQPIDELPTPLPQTGPALRVGQDVEVPAGGRIVFRRYDERTGQPTDLFSCLDWQPVPGSKNEIRVTGPELAMVLPSGMVATVLADEGQLTAERIERQQMRPRSGWLAGNVRIVIDRDTTPGRPPRDARPQDLITLFVDRLEFDLERGELRSADRVVVQSLEFEVVGTGLDLVWSQADNRVETLTLARGEEFVFYTPTSLFDTPDQDETRPGEPASAPAPRTATAPRPSTPRRVTTYLCTLSGGVLAEQYRADQVVGGLRADEVQLLFDIGARAGRFLRAPASRPQAAEQDRGQRLVVRWSGKLTLAPIDSPPPPGRHRLHFTASGAPVALARGEGTILCGKVRYEDESRRIWLESLPGESIDFALGEKMSAAAAGVYVDRTQRLVKLIGPLVLRSQRGTGPATRWSTVHAQLWGELTLAEPASTSRPAAEAMLEFERLESATFVGEVRVDLGKQKLIADSLQVTFRPDAGEQTLEELLDTAIATGRVRLTSEDGTVESQALALTFARTPERTLYPSRMHARGAVRLARERARIRGDEVQAELAPGPREAEGRGPEFVLRTLEVAGRAEVVDPDHRRAARGARITSQFIEPDWLATATVQGTSERPGLVYAHPFIVRGQQIDLDRSAQTLHVEGPARLSFRSQRSLQGQQRKELTPVVVTSQNRLHIDGRGNTVRFEGRVVATSREEQLQSDALTLLLEDIAPRPQQRAPRVPSWVDWYRAARALVDRFEGHPTRSRSPLAWEEGLERVRKEPVRLIADNGLVSSESFVPGDPEPVVHASISAPQLEFDLVNRQIHASGLTQLLLTDRRGRDDPQVTGEVLGLPSAFMSRGPSQTAMQCTGRMTYTLGPDGPERRDTVIFEDDVFFVHRTGGAMINLAEALPRPTHAVAEIPPGRNATLECERLECWFVVDQEGSVPQRGGGLTRTPMRLASLLASGSVYLRDEFGPRVREVNAAWIEFNREQSVINVRSTDVAEARVYFENTASGQLDVHTGKQLVIDLRDGTVRSGELRGHLRRP